MSESESQQSDEAFKCTKFSLQTVNFGFDLYNKIIEGNQPHNVIISPLSVQIAAILTFLGASGDTAKEMVHGLRVSLEGDKDIQETCKVVLEKFLNSSAIQIANKIYVSDRFKLKDEFCKMVSNFKSEVETINFFEKDEACKIMNEWIEKKTEHPKDMFNPEDLDDKTSSIMLNAVQFKPRWKTAFAEVLSHSDKFYVTENESVEVVYMRQWDENLHCWGIYDAFTDFGVDVVLLPFADDDLSMLVLLPLKHEDISKLERRLCKAEVLENIMGKYNIRNAELFLPRFDIAVHVDLKKPFEKMNMKKLFTHKADFSKMAESPDGMCVNKIVHNAVIEITEDGVEPGNDKVMPVYEDCYSPTVKVNKPFIYLILDSDFNVLLLGKMVRPKARKSISE